MKAHLLYRDQDFDLRRPLPWNHAALTADLALSTLFNAMARGDKFIFDVTEKVILAGLKNDLDVIRYRQSILQDCLSHPAVVRDLYQIAVEAKEDQKKRFFLGSLSRRPEWLLRESVELVEILLLLVRKIRHIADAHAGTFASEGWKAFFAMLQVELTDRYFAAATQHLEQLKFRKGVLLSARLGPGNKAINYVLHALPYRHLRGWEWLKSVVEDRLGSLTKANSSNQPVFKFSIDPRDESGARCLQELRDRGLGHVANALAQSAEHLRAFFSMLQMELAFYVGCVNLHEELARKGEPACFPSAGASDERQMSFQGLYDPCLSLNMKQRAVGNDVDADRKDLIIVTGANQGGKSTFLRGIGLAQLMMQAGMFVPAEMFSGSLCGGLFTHFKREEDSNMKSGKLDEELSRMSAIVDHLTPGSVILFNESFAATNEREGSEIARHIVCALRDRGIKVFFVTHLYEFARTFHERNDAKALFLRAERQPDGTRTFRLVEGVPQETSFGEDLYKNVFGGAAQSELATPITQRDLP